MNVIFLTLIDFNNINDRSIYHDLLRKFRDEGHSVYVIYPTERRKGEKTSITVQEGISLLKVKTLNIQKTNLLEKGIGTLLLEYQFLRAFKKNFSNIRFDLILYSTPPITLTKIISHIKQKEAALSYLLLKDIFPQNAVDLGMIKKGGLLHNFFSKKEKKLYEISDFIGCMSPANVSFLKQQNPKLDQRKLEVNPNSISMVQESVFVDKGSIRKRYGIPEDVIVFLYGGNLGKPQGIDFLINVLDSNSTNQNVFFLIVGGGTEYKTIERWYNKNHPPNTLLMKTLPQNEYDELAKVSDIGLIFLDKRFTIPNFPSRLLSYLENRMPILAATDINTDIGPVLHRAGCGFWCESGDLNNYNKLLNTFVKQRSLIEKMGENSYKLLLENFRVERTFDLIVQKSK
jgi:glycosyltransferase involved in cell wall biosynthesis